MKKISPNALFLIDGSAFLYRAYYGLRPMHTSTGIPVQATYGFCRMIKKVMNEFDPKYLVILWDSRGKTVRTEIYEEYKATRQAPPSDLGDQKQQIIEFADLIGLCQVAKPGYEADDLIASVVEENKQREVVIITSDKDLYQLIDKNVFVYDPFKKEIIDEEKFIEDRGFEPKELLLYHALLGDSSDNIPGVRGIGKKGAEELVLQFGTLDNLYENLDQVKKDRTRKLLEEQKKEAYLSQELFELIIIKTKKKLKDFLFDKDDWSNAYQFFTELEFKSLVRGIKLPEANKTIFDIETAAKKKKEALPRGYGVPEKKSAVKENWEYVAVQSEDALEDLITTLKSSEFFALDAETTGLKPLQDELVGLSFACDKKTCYYVPFAHKEGVQLDRDYVLNKLKPVLESSRYKKTLHNAKFDRLALAQYGIELDGIAFDSLLAANLVRRAWQKIGLKSLSVFYLDEPMRSFADVLKKKKDFSYCSIEEGGKYSAHDSLQTYKLKLVLEKELNKSKKLKDIFFNVELPLCNVLYRMEYYGITLKPEVLSELGREAERKLRKIERKILGLIGALRKTEGVVINLNSPQQVEKLLFDELKLPVVRKSEEGRRSTNQYVLEGLSKFHPIPGLILKYRELSKLISTYIYPLQEHVNPNTGRIHTTYSQTDAATGRLASYSPNLQNIPAGEGLGLRIRSAFVAPRNKIFLSADYSQIELRVLAHITKDKNLIKAFAADHDIHSEAAARIFGVPLSKVTKEQRQVGKRINFSIMYGLTPYGLSKDLGIKQSEAKRYIEQYFEEYPGVAKWMEKTIEKATEKGYTETYFGRRRYFPGLQEANRTVYEHAKRAAVNSPIQGTASEIVKLAMLCLEKEFCKKKLQAQMVLQIHDEVVIELPKDELDVVERLVKKCLEKVVDWDVPLKVDIKTGNTWEKVTK